MIGIKPLAEGLTSSELAWMLAGGICYTAGVPFYVWKSRKYTHAVRTRANVSGTGHVHDSNAT